MLEAPAGRFNPFAEYPAFERWPLILAGPILRRTEPAAVTVWLALRAPCQIRLTVYATADHGATLSEPRLAGESQTLRVGKHLHIAAVTATPPDGLPLSSGQIYAYDVQLIPQGDTAENVPLSLERALTGSAQLPAPISYFNHQKPTFALPPQRLEHLRLIHASCRKPHADGYDALPILDSLVEATASQPHQRPQQLFLTGDQIYGDDVAEPLLWAATHLGEALLGWKEALPVESTTRTGTEAKSSPPRRRRLRIFPSRLMPGKRAAIATHKGGFTAGLDNKPEKVNSHLFGLGEFVATYLMVWSPVCWPDQFPDYFDQAVVGETRQRQRRAARLWRHQVEVLRQFQHTLWKVRRALANVPTYTLFDDHDVSDDWNLNQAWCLRVLGQSLGQRTVQNALTACALFQAWGNTPQQFQADQSGAKLLQAISVWSASGGSDLTAYQQVTQYLGLPPTDPTTQLPQFVTEGDLLLLARHEDAIAWHYSLESECHQVIALDTRTWRGFPMDDDALAPPMILPPRAIADQITRLLPAEQPQRLTLVISPTNLFSLKAIDWAQEFALKQGPAKIYGNDVGDAWNIPSDGLAAFMMSLFKQRQQLVVLSGDIHYSFAVRLLFSLTSAGKPANLDSELPTQATMVQLTASPLKNEETITRLIHTRLKQWLLPERTRYWQGWVQPSRMRERPRWQLRRPFGKDGQRADLPDWVCTLEWLPRQPALTPSFGAEIPWLAVSKQPQSDDWAAAFRFWQSRWFQDGREVVGLNNLAVVRFETEGAAAPIVIQDTYWFTPSTPTQIQLSRFAGALDFNRRL